MSIYDEANDAFERGDLDRVRELLEPGANAGDHDAQAALGTFLTLTTVQSGFLEGVRWLRTAADAGDGLAAYNLATILLSGGLGVEPDPDEALRYLQRAREQGIEAIVSSDG